MWLNMKKVTDKHILSLYLIVDNNFYITILASHCDFFLHPAVTPCPYHNFFFAPHRNTYFTPPMFEAFVHGYQTVS